jgi:hypothetical protein
MKLKIILNSILSEAKEKYTFEVENVYLNGRRIKGITQAYSESQALFNLIWRSLPESQRHSMAQIKLSDAKRIGGYKIKRIATPSIKDVSVRLPYRDD